MRFLIGCDNICGLIQTLSTELQRRGDSVITISDKKPFFDHQYDYDFSNITYNFFSKGKPNFFTKVFFRVCEIIERKYPDFRRVIILYLLSRKFDTYIFIWQGLVNEEKLFRILKKLNKKIIVLFLGDDVRHYFAFSQQYDVSVWEFPERYTHKNIFRSLTILRYAEKYADVIFSVPDQMSLAIRPYKHVKIPINVSDFNFINHKRKVPKIVHLPSEPFLKGSDKIMAALDELQKEGLEFEAIYKSKIPHAEVKRLLEEADILVDELILHGPGVLSFEAMASGCAVATLYLEEFKDVFFPPVCAITYKNIKEKLRELILNYEYRQKLILEGYNYVRENNNVESIVNELKASINGAEQKMDYFPEFYTTKFRRDEKDAARYKQLDNILK